MEPYYAQCIPKKAPSSSPFASCLSADSAVTAWYRLDVEASGIRIQPSPSDGHDGAFVELRHDAHDLVPWADVLGAALLVGNEPTESHDDATGFVIFTCPPRRKADSSWKCRPEATSNATIERELVDRRFHMNTRDEKQRMTLLVETIRRRANPMHQAIANGVESPVPQRSFLVLINPVSGSGAAKKTYETVVAPVLAQSGIDTKVIVTQYQAHATEVAATLPLDQYNCVVGVGGDGLLAEIVQGLMQRADWKLAIHQPLGMIQGGSGNGLVSSLLAQHNEEMTPLNAAYALAKGTPQDLDIATVKNGHGDTMYSFLSVNFGLCADIDIESERFRMFGDARFTVTGVTKLVSRIRKYPATLRYLVSDIPPPRYEDHDHKRNDEIAPCSDCYTSEASVGENGNEVDAKTLDNGHWEEIKADFQAIWAMNVTHATADSVIVRDASVDDGYYHIMCIPKTISRVEMYKFLDGTADGKHIDLESVQVIRTRAFTLHVDNPAQRLVVDGEIFAGPSLQVEVHRGLGRMMFLPHTQEASGSVAA